MSEREIIRHPRISGISLFFDTVEYRTPHSHPEWELVWIVDGELAVNSGQTEAVCKMGELCLFAPNRLHEFRQRGRAATFLCLQIAPQVFSYSCPSFSALKLDEFRLTPFLNPDETGEIQTRMKILMTDYLTGAPFFELRCTAACAELFSMLLTLLPFRRMSEKESANADWLNERMARFLAFVDENYTQKITLEEFARQEHCSVSYMSRFVKSNLNQSFQDYVNTMRFYYACRMIDTGGKRMIDVCEESGFSDYRYFSKCFKKMCGMTPEEYRKAKPAADPEPAQHSLHSLERFYTKEESEELLRSL